MTDHVIDLRSDTLSLPTEEMLKAIQEARLGDDSRDGDPTVLELEALIAEMLGKEAAIIGSVGEVSDTAMVEMITSIGGRRIVQMPYGRELPRIC